MPGEQRLLLALEMSLFAGELAKEHIRREYPEWSDPHPEGVSGSVREEKKGATIFPHTRSGQSTRQSVCLS
jgi:hypothetical protein